MSAGTPEAIDGYDVGAAQAACGALVVVAVLANGSRG